MTDHASDQTVLCSARGCGSAATWTTSVVAEGGTYIIPVCREHGTAMSARHGVAGLDWWEERGTR
jgi:hypothetical protein